MQAFAQPQIHTPCAAGARFSARAGVSRPCSRRNASCQASARQQSGAADGREPYRSSESIDAEWQKVKLQPVWQRLDAELDCRAAHSVAEEVTVTFDDNVGSNNTAMPTVDSLPGRDSVPDALWPSLAARQAAYSSSGNQQAWLQDLSQVYVILFGVGSTDTEGIYSLRVMSRDDGLPQDTIIAFSCEEDADRYAGLLEATMDHVPSVCPIEPAELLDFCTDSGYSYRVEAQGSLLIPPDYYVGMTDWERSLRLREGKWTVMDRDQPSPSTSPAEQAQAADQQPQHLNNANFYPLSEPNFQLEEARASLERLLMRDC
jgi:hypothetical protein